MKNVTKRTKLFMGIKSADGSGLLKDAIQLAKAEEKLKKEKDSVKSDFSKFRSEFESYLKSVKQDDDWKDYTYVKMFADESYTGGSTGKAVEKYINGLIEFAKSRPHIDLSELGL